MNKQEISVSQLGNLIVMTRQDFDRIMETFRLIEAGEIHTETHVIERNVPEVRDGQQPNS